MQLAFLRVIHLKKGPLTDPGAAAAVQKLMPGNVFCLDSCQRWIWIGSAQDFSSDVVSRIPGVAVYAGVEGYLFLLRVASGLESQIVGETDIFGQLKEAWRRSSACSELASFMQGVFEDTKEIRSRYMQNLGGASYGSLVRMLLRGRSGPTLVVGAGLLAQSVAPYLLDQEVWLTNRSQESLGLLYSDLISRQASHTERSEVRVIFQGEEDLAWSQAANVVVCIPFDELKDADRVALRMAREQGGVVIHLGGMRENSGSWEKLPVFHSLDDLFALQKAQGDVRMTQIEHAAHACEERAKLRALGASVTIPHGWEDLAVFA